MKKLKIKWLVWTGKVLSSMVAMLGMSSCFFQPSMYGDSAKRAPQKEFRAMYSVRPAIYKQNVIDKEGVDIEVMQD